MAFGFFVYNRQAIESTACVNKAKPQKKCHGKCYLKKKLLEQNEKKGGPVQDIQDPKTAVFFNPVSVLTELPIVAYFKTQPDFVPAQHGGCYLAINDPPPNPLA
ncbi:MAG TPA: hypothetical protein VFX48_02490 [Saprospiraceae bacterium]|nr:hypothetical protein [Saprospiraceae bacterium]